MLTKLLISPSTLPLNPLCMVTSASLVTVSSPDSSIAVTLASNEYSMAAYSRSAAADDASDNARNGVDGVHYHFHKDESRAPALAAELRVERTGLCTWWTL
jgi:hypothetical protein